MTPSLLLFAGLVLMLLAGVLPVHGGDPAVVFRSPAFIVLLVLLSGLLLRECARRLSPWQTGFLLAHGGVVLILMGAAAAHWMGVRTHVAVPVGGGHVVRRLPPAAPGPDGRPQASEEFGFGLSVTNLTVEFHEPRYSVFSPSGNQDGGTGGLAFEQRVPVRPDGSVEVGNGERLEAASLHDPVTGAWLREIVTSSGRVLRIARTARRYSAAGRFDGGPAVGAADFEITMNRPAVFRGWRFYLMDYDHEAGRYVVLIARRDPGRPIVIAGIWAIIAGAGILCFRRSEPVADPAARGTG